MRALREYKKRTNRQRKKETKQTNFEMTVKVDKQDGGRKKKVQMTIQISVKTKKKVCFFFFSFDDN